jgi:hypothetical protein
MAYLLHPLVSRIVSWGTSRQRAVLFVFALVSIAFAGILLWVLPAISTQSVNLARRVPGYTLRLKELAMDFAEEVRMKHGIRLLPQLQPGEPSVSPGAPPEDPTIKVMEPEEPPSLARAQAPLDQKHSDLAAVQAATTAEAEQLYDLQHLVSAIGCGPRCLPSCEMDGI